MNASKITRTKNELIFCNLIFYQLINFHLTITNLKMNINKFTIMHICIFSLEKF